MPSSALKKKNNDQHGWVATPVLPLRAIPPWTLPERLGGAGAPGGARARPGRRGYARFFFFFNDTATTEIYTLSLPGALPISCTVDPSAPTVAARPSPSAPGPF